MSILRVDVSNPSDYEILALSNITGSFYKSTKYFESDGTGSYGLTFTYTGSDLATCGYIVINSIALVNFVCDTSCTSCTINNTCTCTVASQYLTNLNTCASCPTGC